MSPVPASAPILLQPERLCEHVRVDLSCELYAVLCGAHLTGLQALLRQLGADRCDSLWTGLLEPREGAESPLLCRVPRGGDLQEWLFRQLCGDLAHIGVLLLSGASYLQVRAHCRDLCFARSSDGEALRLDWMDPQVLELLLPLLELRQANELLGPHAQLLIPGAQSWQVLHRDERRQPVIQRIDLDRERRQ